MIDIINSLSSFQSFAVTALTILIVIVLGILVEGNLKARCYNNGSKHNFKSRYTEVRNRFRSIEGWGNIRDLLYSNEYVQDVCKWCGKTTKEIR